MIEITYDDLSELIDKDETAERDIKIGYQNSIAIAKDIKDKKPLNVYWCVRQTQEYQYKKSFRCGC